jgi:hypothetical protein
MGEMVWKNEKKRIRGEKEKKKKEGFDEEEESESIVQRKEGRKG